MRVAFFIYERGLNLHLFNMVKGFVDKGDEVLLFIHDTDEYVFGLNNFREIYVKIFNLFKVNSIINRIIRKLRKFEFELLYSLNRNVKDLMISDRTLNRSSKIISRIGTVDLAIGVEKKGMIWAGKLFEGTKTKLIYYSLELYEDGHYSYVNDKTFPFVRSEEKHYHPKFDATIIQDADRCKFLYGINGIEQQRAFYLPVSVSKESSVIIPDYLVNKIKMQKNKVVLYFGRIDDHRKSYTIAKAFSEKYSEDFILALNGAADTDYISGILKLSTRIFHFDKSPEKYIDSIISNAHIGLVPYEYKSVNDDLTVFASEKMAYYLKHGKPVIAFSNSQYEKFFNVYKCGIAIKDSSGLWDAIRKIDSDYLTYQQAAFSTFEKFFCFENGFQKIYEEMSSLLT